MKKTPSAVVLGATVYDRVTALLLSLICTLGGVTLALAFIWWVHLAETEADEGSLTPVTQIEVGEDWGGIPDGGSIDGLELPGPAGREPGVGGEDEFGDTTQLQQAITGLLSEVGQAVELSEQLHAGSDSRAAGLTARSIGVGSKRSLGDGIGKGGGVPAHKRWEILFEDGMTLDEYARQLDAMGTELAVASQGRVLAVSRFSDAKALVREVDISSARGQIFFIWRGEHRRRVDMGLLDRVIPEMVRENAVVMHFYSHETALRLATLEREFAVAHGRPNLRQVAKTVFSVKRAGQAYEFQVVRQSYLGQ